MTLAQTDTLRRNFNEFIVFDEFDCIFQRHLDRWHEPDRFIRTGSTNIGQLFSLDRIDDKIVFTRMNTDNHAFINRIVVIDEHTAPFLQFPQCISNRAPGNAILTALEGTAVIGYEGTDYTLNAGESFRFEKNGLHSVTAKGRFKMSLLLVLE